MAADSISPGAVKSEDEHRREICTAGRWIHGRGFVASTDGNISIRLDSRRVLTSPTSISKGLMSPDDIVITDLQGRKLAGRREPSTEIAMHLLIIGGDRTSTPFAMRTLRLPRLTLRPDYLSIRRF